jgi:nuclear transport factor 2 (NTF2) superfamily protein
VPTRPPIPPFTRETAVEKVPLAEDAWNSRDPAHVALSYTEDSRWRNRSEFFHGRAAIVEFLTRKWANELDYRLIKESFGRSMKTGSVPASNMSGAMIPAIGFAHTATSNGNSTAMD